MYNDDYVNNFGSSGETPPEDNSADTAQQSAPLETGSGLFCSAAARAGQL